MGGMVGGVVCHEHVGSPRRWTPEEQAFAGSVGDLVSLAMEADRRIRAERALREGEEFFHAVGDRLHDAMLLVDVTIAIIPSCDSERGRLPAIRL